MIRIDKMCVIGFNYRGHDISKREEFIHHIKPKKKHDEIKMKLGKCDVVLVDTCLRVEFYIYGENVSEEFLRELFPGYENEIYFHSGIKCIKHLFSLACGLDSVIPGEDQILAQIKERYITELEKGITSKEMNVIFNNAIALGKKFRTISGVACMPLSLENIAVKYIEREIGLDNKTVLVIGTGAVSREIITILIKKGVKNITVTNRSRGRSVDLSNELGVQSVEFHNRYEAINQSDIVVSATSAPHYVVYRDEYMKLCSGGKKRVFIDLAVPRDIDINIENEENKIINIEELNESAVRNIEMRKKICINHTHLIDEQVVKCLKWFERNRAGGETGEK